MAAQCNTARTGIRGRIAKQAGEQARKVVQLARAQKWVADPPRSFDLSPHKVLHVAAVQRRVKGVTSSPVRPLGGRAASTEAVGGRLGVRQDGGDLDPKRGKVRAVPLRPSANAPR